MAKQRKQITVTDENFGDLLVESAEQALGIARGTERAARVRTRQRTAKDTAIVAPPAYDAGRIARVRAALRMSQDVFAGALNVSASTVRAWERGARVPEGPSLRLLELAEAHPRMFTALARPVR